MLGSLADQRRGDVVCDRVCDTGKRSDDSLKNVQRAQSVSEFQFYINFNGVMGCGGVELMENHTRGRKVPTTVSVLLFYWDYFIAETVLNDK